MPINMDGPSDKCFLRERAGNQFCKGKSQYYFSSELMEANSNNNILVASVSPTDID